MTQGSSIAMLISAFPTSERGRALGLLISVVGVGAIVGPVLGGIIVDVLGWRWVFFTSSVLGAISTVVAVVILMENPRIKAVKLSSFDWLGATLSAGGLVIFMVSITSGPRIGWASPTVVIGLLTFLTLLTVFIFWERRVQTPMLDMNLFIYRPFSLGILGTFLSFIGMSSVGFLMPFYLQYVLGFTPTYVGLIIVPSGICFAVIGPISGRLSDRYGWRRFNIVGITLCTIGLFILSTIGSTSPLWFVMFGIILQSSGMGLFNAPNSSSIFSVVEQRAFGVVSGFLNLARNASNVTGIALVTAIVTATMSSMGHPTTLAAISESTNGNLLGSFISGIRTAYSIVGGILVVGIITSLFNKPTTPKVT